MSPNIIIILLMLQGISMGLFAQSMLADSLNVLDSVLKYRLLQEVVITGEYAETVVEKSIYSTTVIQQKKIGQMGAVQLKDVLWQQNNIRIGQDQILGSSMSMQGLGGNNIKILVDGVPVIGRLNGNVDLSQISLQHAERIEIIEGPMAVQFGSNALGGTINIITQKNKKNTVELLSYYESSGHYNISPSFTLIKNQWYLNLHGARNYFDGWKNTEKPFYFNPHPVADSSRFQSWKPKEQWLYTAEAGFEQDSFTMKLKHHFFTETIWNKGAPKSPYFETALDDKYQTHRRDYTAFVKWKKPKHTIDFMASYNQYIRIKNSYFKDLTSLETTYLDASLQDTSLIDFWMSRASFFYFPKKEKISLEIGYDIGLETFLGVRVDAKTRNMQYYDIFSTFQYKINARLTGKLGLRYGYNSAYATIPIPSFHTNYYLGKDWSIKASYGRGYRAPSLKELYFYFIDINHYIVGNDALQAESSHHGQLSVHKYWDFNKQQIVSQHITVSSNWVKNLITLAGVDNLEFSYTNIGYVKNYMGKYNLQYKSNHFAVQGTYSMLAFQAQTDSLWPMTYTSELALEISCPFKYITPSVFYKWNGPSTQFILGDFGAQQSSTQAYQLLDVTAQIHAYEKLDIVLGARNILDVRNLQNNNQTQVAHSGGGSIPFANGRTYFIRLNWRIL